MRFLCAKQSRTGFFATTLYQLCSTKMSGNEDFEAEIINCETDKEVTSSDESFLEEKPHYYTRFKIRDHVKALFKANDGRTIDGREEGRSSEDRPTRHLIRCLATKMILSNEHDCLIHHHLKTERQLKWKTNVEVFPSQWCLWVQTDENDEKVESKMKINNTKALGLMIRTINAEYTMRKKLHLLRAEITPITKNVYSKLSIFMKVLPTDELHCLQVFARVILLDKISQPMNIKGMCIADQKNHNN